MYTITIEALKNGEWTVFLDRSTDEDLIREYWEYCKETFPAARMTHEKEATA